MKLKNFLFSLALLFSIHAFGQEDDFTTEVGTYLDSNHALDQYDFAYDQLLKMLGNQFPKTTENASGWTYLEENRPKAMADMKTMLISIYAKHFSKEEILQMTEFYNSETGKQLVADRSKMTEAQKEELNTYYNTELGAKIIAKQSVLGQEIAAISETWSRELYEVAMSLLKG